VAPVALALDVSGAQRAYSRSHTSRARARARPGNARADGPAGVRAGKHPGSEPGDEYADRRGALQLVTGSRSPEFPGDDGASSSGTSELSWSVRLCADQHLVDGAGESRDEAVPALLVSSPFGHDRERVALAGQRAHDAGVMHNGADVARLACELDAVGKACGDSVPQPLVAKDLTHAPARVGGCRAVLGDR